MRHLFAIPFALCVLASALITPAHADIYLQPFKNQATPKEVWRLAPELGLYSASENYDTSGNAVTPIGLQSFSKVIFNGLIAYGITDKITLYGRINWSMTKLDITTKQTTTLGFGDQALGAGFRLVEWSDGSAIDAQAQMELPAYSNDTARTNGDVLLGDGSIDGIGGIFLHWVLLHSKTWQLFSDIGGGYRYRTDGYSPDLPYFLGLRAEPTTSGLTGGLSIYGMKSFENDAKVRPTGQAPGSGTGGLFISEAKNASLTWVGGELGYKFAPAFELSLRGATAMTGLSAAKGTLIALAAQISLGGEDKQDNPLRQDPGEYGKSNQGFVDYTFEAKVTGANDRLNMIKIGKGSEAGLKVGQTLDVFRVDAQGQPKDAVARTKVTSVKEGEAVLSVKEYFKEVWIEEGFIVKRPLQ